MGHSNILLNHQLAGEIISLIDSSQEYCFLVTPYYEPWQLLNRALEKAASNEKKIIFIFRNGEVKKEVLEALNNMGFDIHLIEKLHTKLYLNEKTAIITSMNLFNASKEKNYEVGYKFSSSSASKKFKEEVIESDILKSKHKNSFPGRYDTYLKELAQEKINLSKNKTDLTPGYCLRCGVEIPFDFKKPYCLKCYKDWAKINYPTKENYCHSCGTRFHSSYEHPACSKCG